MVATLFCLVGLPASGKSTAARQIQTLYPDLIVVSPDRIRAQLYDDAAIQGDWAAIESVVEQGLAQASTAIALGQSPLAIYDATNANPTHRTGAIALARGCGFTRVIGLWLDCPITLCLTRNQARSRQVPEAVLEWMEAMLRSHPPQLADGFDQVIRITPAMPLLVWLPQVAALV
jgi:predicted kinase